MGMKTSRRRGVKVLQVWQRQLRLEKITQRWTRLRGREWANPRLGTAIQPGARNVLHRSVLVGGEAVRGVIGIPLMEPL